MKTYLVLTERKRTSRKLSIAIWEFTGDNEHYIKLINNNIVVSKFVNGIHTESQQYLKNKVAEYVTEKEFNVIHISATELGYFNNFKVIKM